VLGDGEFHRGPAHPTARSSAEVTVAHVGSRLRHIDRFPHDRSHALTTE
jgi:hypothetical protein